jgi:hypothetical protein
MLLCGPDNKWVSWSQWSNDIAYSVRRDGDLEGLVKGLCGAHVVQPKEDDKKKGRGRPARYYRLMEPIGREEWFKRFGQMKKKQVKKTS